MGWGGLGFVDELNSGSGLGNVFFGGSVGKGNGTFLVLRWRVFLEGFIRILHVVGVRILMGFWSTLREDGRVVVVVKCKETCMASEKVK